MAAGEVTAAVVGTTDGGVVVGAAAGGAAAGAAAGGAAAAGAAGLEPPIGGGEERRTRGWKARPPQVFTILDPEKEKNRGGGLQKNGNGM